MSHSRNRAFTLIELLVVIAVLAVLAVLAVPRLLGYTKQASATRLKYDARLLADASQRYYLANGDWPRASDTPYTADQVAAFSAKVSDQTGKVIALDPSGNYYDLDMAKLSPYVSLREDPKNFVLQNPVGSIYFMDPQTNTRLSGKPTAVITMTPNTGITTDTSISWSYAGSVDPNGGTVIDAKWTGMLANYPTPGTYTVKLQVENSEGVWSDPVSTTFTVAAPATKPVAVITMTPNQGILTTTTITWDASGSYDTNTGGTITATEWTGKQDVYPTPGTYTVSLRVQNSAGLWSDSVSTTFYVGNAKEIVQIATGYYHTLALLKDGTVKAWGDNSYGQLGIGSTVQQNSPVVVPGLTNVKSLAAGDCHSLAVLNDGTVMAWGRGDYGQLGLGSAGAVQKNSPTAIPNLTGVQRVTAGALYSAALLSNGTVKTWGNNSYGQLGTGGTTTQYSPVLVSSLTGVQQLVAGEMHMVALLSDGTLKAWGSNSYGQLGIGSTATQYTPTTVPGVTGVAQIGANMHTVALLQNGTVKTWGYNYYGQLGNSTTTDQHSPVSLSLSGVTAIAVGRNNTLFLLQDGTAKNCGANDSGQMGIGGSINANKYSTPTAISSLTNVATIQAGDSSFVVTLQDHTAKTWGANTKGQLGVGNTTTQTSPVLITSLN